MFNQVKSGFTIRKLTESLKVCAPFLHLSRNAEKAPLTEEDFRFSARGTRKERGRILRSEIMNVMPGSTRQFYGKLRDNGRINDFVAIERWFALNYYREDGGGKREYRSSEFAKGQPKDLAHKGAGVVDSRMN